MIDGNPQGMSQNWQMAHVHVAGNWPGYFVNVFHKFINKPVGDMAARSRWKAGRRD